MNNPLQVIVDGLTYQGNLLDSIINYVLIAVSIAPFLVVAARARSSIGNQWMLCLLISIVVQVVLWFGLDAVGVSVVWATIAGYDLMVRTVRRIVLDSRQRALFTAALFLLALGILYYAATLPFITTLAHLIAAVLGISIFWLLRIRNLSSSAAQRRPEQ